jgi:hypothetical protein
MSPILYLYILIAPIDSSISQFQTALDCIRQHPIVVAYVYETGGDTSNIKIKVKKKTKLMENQSIAQRIGFLKAYMNTKNWEKKDSLERVKFISSSDSFDVMLKSLSWHEFGIIEKSELFIWRHYMDVFKSAIVPTLNNQVTDTEANDLSVTFYPYVDETLIAEFSFSKSVHNSSGVVYCVFLFKDHQ